MCRLERLHTVLKGLQSSTLELFIITYEEQSFKIRQLLRFLSTSHSAPAGRRVSTVLWRKY